MNEEMTLAEWLEHYRRQEEDAGSRATAAAVRAMGRHVRMYERGRAQENTPIKEVDRDFCEGFARYLGTATSLRGGGRVLSARTGRQYMVVLKAALNVAVREGLIDVNPVNQVRRELRPRLPDSRRVFLDREEVRRLQMSELGDDGTRRAFLFSCFCGLRISDIRRLTWGNLDPVADGRGRRTYRLSIVMRKTGRLLSFILNQEALRCLPRERGDDGECVFSLPSAVTVNRHVGRWAREAGIGKHVSFHSARHTFATLALTLGVDIYTTSKLLGHTSVATTQIYARVVDRKKDEAMLLFDERF